MGRDVQTISCDSDSVQISEVLMCCLVYRSIWTKCESENRHAGMTASAVGVLADEEVKTIATTWCREQAFPPGKGEGCGPWRPVLDRFL